MSIAVLRLQRTSTLPAIGEEQNDFRLERHKGPHNYFYNFYACCHYRTRAWVQVDGTPSRITLVVENAVCTLDDDRAKPTLKTKHIQVRDEKSITDKCTQWHIICVR